MNCINCQAPLPEGAVFCNTCGANQQTKPPASNLPNATKTKKCHSPHRFLPFILGAVSGALVVALIGGIFLLPARNRSATTTVSQTIEGGGYNSAEEAANAYFTALRKGDVKGMFSTFAIETYIENYNMTAQLERMKVYSPLMMPKLPSSNDFNKDLGIFQRQGELATTLTQQYTTICIPELGLSEMKPIAFSEEPDPEKALHEFMQAMEKGTNPNKLEAVKLESFINPEDLSPHYSSEKNKEYLRLRANAFGADAIESIAAMVTIEEDTYLFCFDAICHSNKWYLLEPCGNVGTLLSISTNTGGVALLPENFSLDELKE